VLDDRVLPYSGTVMKEADRRTLADLRRALLQLHKSLLEFERAAYERAHGRTSPGELLKVIVSDEQFAWLRPISELIGRIDGALQTEEPDVPVDIDPLVTQARGIVALAEHGDAYADRYRAALQARPDAVIAHGKVATLLKDVPSRETLH
jgi:hypothetical protein